MKNPRFLLTLTLIALLVGACTAETTLDANDAPAREGELQQGDVPAERFQHLQGRAGIDASEVYTFEDMRRVGTSKLVRTESGVSFELKTSELVPGDVVTLWMVVFNKPEECSDPCNEDDLGNPDVMTDVLYASGRIIGGSGKAGYAGRRNVGDSDGSIFPAWLGLPSPGLLDAREAEIHFVVHTHGPRISELTSEMLHTFNAGCGPIFDPSLPPVPEELGTYGPNTCESVHFAIHVP